MTGGVGDDVAQSQARWRRVRRELNRGRAELAGVAAALYPSAERFEARTFLALPRWIPARPVRIEGVRLEWSGTVGLAAVRGREAAAAGVLPLREPGVRFDRYTSAVGCLDRPALFEDRDSYRLLDVDLAGQRPWMRFGLGRYFEKLDVAEGVAHELAAAGEADWARLPLRASVGDPFDLRRRAVMPAIETVTLRRDRRTGRATFLLHWRDPAKVATAAGIYGCIPAGEFQPCSGAQWDRVNDFDLWRNMVREYAEELLGEPERDGASGEPLDYPGWPLYRDLESARAQGRVAVFVLGLGMDTLTLEATVVTAVVLDDDVFDELFGATVPINAEGTLVAARGATAVTDGVPFTAASVRWLLGEPMVSPGRCMLARAWRFRADLLG